MFRILVFYQDEKALNEYLDKFNLIHDPDIKIWISYNLRQYKGEHSIIICQRGLKDDLTGCGKVDFIAVQEDLTWNEGWPKLRDHVLEPVKDSPIPIHIFDGIPYEEAVESEEEKNKWGAPWV